MTDKILIDRATLEQLVAALNNAEDALNNSQALIAGRERFGFAKPCYGANEIALGFVSLAITEGRAALANAETAGWRTLVDQGKEAHELANIMKDFADKNPESLMLKELK